MGDDCRGFATEQQSSVSKEQQVADNENENEEQQSAVNEDQQVADNEDENEEQ